MSATIDQRGTGANNAGGRIEAAPSGAFDRDSTPLSLNRNICQHFEARVAQSPFDEAVVDESCAVTFQQLDNAANVIAGQLCERGFRRGEIAALLVERNAMAIAAMLGILKAGGAYLPLDAHAPRKRIESIVRDSGATALVTTPSAAGEARLDELFDKDASATHGSSDPRRLEPAFAPDGTEAKRCGALYLDWNILQPPAFVSDKLPDTAPGDLAYVIYTSGSTGVPKGTMIEHRNVVSLVEALRETIFAQHGMRLRVAVVAPFVFDASVQQIFPSLLCGHVLYIVPEPARRDARLLADFYVRHSIDVSDGTPSHLKILSRATSSVGDELPVKHFIIGGEPLRAADVLGFLRRFGASRPSITNIYGTAECSVDSASYTIDPETLDGQENIPIGTVLPGTQAYILNERMEMLPDGEIGELCLAGSGVGRGYLKSPTLTAERFVPNPFQADAIIYRTGDLAARRPDGMLMLFGRKDRQMKVRGYRIDPTEIEARLLGYAATNGTRSIQLPIYGQSDADASPVQCSVCLLSNAYPGINVDARGVCNVCRQFEKYKTHATQYFRTSTEFDEIMRAARATKRGAHDCLLLYSGGKDSTYVLYKLISKGLKVLTFTFDNGFISEGAFQNIKRITERFGIEHITLNAERMNEVFVESLMDEKSVCGGCFRALTALSTRLAEERGINVVITGLSRGQIFDTKLKELFQANVFDPAEIERRLIVHRKMYHLRNDAITSLLNAPVVESSIDKIFFIDYFRYDPASGPDVMSYLTERDERWRRPEDTGFCSTNCRINNVGIYVHQVERGYHNYGAPLSWDVRLGVITREEGLKKLEDDIDDDTVRRILDRIGYAQRRERPVQDAAVLKVDDDTLSAFIVSGDEIEAQKVQQHLRTDLPEYMVPSRIVRLDAMPLTTNGKLDTEALLAALDSQTAAAASPETGETDTEARVRRMWEDVFQRSDIGRDADFFAIGGTSLKATMLISLIDEEFKVEAPLTTVLDHPTIRQLAAFIDTSIDLGHSGKGNGAVSLRKGSGRAARHLFFIHDSSGGVAAVAPLSKQIAPAFNVWGILDDRSDDDEFSLPSIEEMAAGYVEKIRAIQPEGPWHIGGWSFGGVVAYEMMRQLARASQPLGLLTIIDSEAANNLFWDELLKGYVGELRKNFPQVSEMVAPGTDAGRECQALLTRIARFRNAAERVRTCTPDPIAGAVAGWDESGQEALFIALKKVMTHVAALARYFPAGHLQVDLEEFCASRRTEAALPGSWRQLVSGRVRRHVLDGDHRSILKSPTVGRIALILNESLEARFK